MSFEGVDYFGLDALLDEEEIAIRDLVREWVDREVLPTIAHHYIERTFPRELIPQMGELGFFGANLPEEYGCAGLNNVAYGLIMQELERADSGIRSFCSVQGALVMYPIFAFGVGRSEARVAPAAGQRRSHRLLRPHGTGLRLEPRRHDHTGRSGRRRVDPQRRQDVDHERVDGRPGGDLGQDRRSGRRAFDPGVPR